MSLTTIIFLEPDISVYNLSLSISYSPVYILYFHINVLAYSGLVIFGSINNMVVSKDGSPPSYGFKFFIYSIKGSV